MLDIHHGHILPLSLYICGIFQSMKLHSFEISNINHDKVCCKAPVAQ